MIKEALKFAAKVFFIGTIFISAALSLYLMTYDKDTANISEQSNIDPPKDDFESQFSSWDNSHGKLIKYIKEGMHNPKSFEHVETRHKVEGNKMKVGMQYRGTNGFGAIVTNYIIVYVDRQGNILEVVEN